jgi:hypothetical protein
MLIIGQPNLTTGAFKSCTQTGSQKILLHDGKKNLETHFQ